MVVQPSMVPWWCKNSSIPMIPPQQPSHPANGSRIRLEQEAIERRRQEELHLGHDSEPVEFPAGFWGLWMENPRKMLGKPWEKHRKMLV